MRPHAAFDQALCGHMRGLEISLEMAKEEAACSDRNKRMPKTIALSEALNAHDSSI
jgi:hypothetical protein